MNKTCSYSIQLKMKNVFSRSLPVPKKVLTYARRLEKKRENVWHSFDKYFHPLSDCCLELKLLIGYFFNQQLFNLGVGTSYMVLAFGSLLCS